MNTHVSTCTSIQKSLTVPLLILLTGLQVHQNYYQYMYELFVNHKPLASPDQSVPGHDKHHQMSTAESNKNNKNKNK